MYKSNWAQTKDKFQRWWEREKGLNLVVADVVVKSPSYKDIAEYSDYSLNLKKHKQFFEKKSFHGESLPDLGAYLSIKVRKTLDLLYMVWEKVFNEITDIIKADDGYTAFSICNILGKGSTSILQSDISCMLSKEMFEEYELPYLRIQAEKLDNVIYHLDGPGSIRHLDKILEIENISAIQWVTGAGEQGNFSELYYNMYDKITESEKGLYVFLQPEEIEDFANRYKSSRLLIRTRAQN